MPQSTNCPFCSFCNLSTLQSTHAEGPISPSSPASSSLLCRMQNFPNLCACSSVVPTSHWRAGAERAFLTAGMNDAKGRVHPLQLCRGHAEQDKDTCISASRIFCILPSIAFSFPLSRWCKRCIRWCKQCIYHAIGCASCNVTVSICCFLREVNPHFHFENLLALFGRQPIAVARRRGEGGTGFL